MESQSMVFSFYRPKVSTRSGNRIYPLREYGATLLFTKIDCDGFVCLTIGAQKKAEKKLSLVNRAIATIASSPPLQHSKHSLPLHQRSEG